MTPVDSFRATLSDQPPAPRGRYGPSKGAGWPYGFSAAPRHGEGAAAALATRCTIVVERETEDANLEDAG